MTFLVSLHPDVLYTVSMGKYFPKALPLMESQAVPIDDLSMVWMILPTLLTQCFM